VETIEASLPASMPRPPGSLEEAGLTAEFVAGLVIKALHHRGAATGFELADMLALPLQLLDDVIQELQERRFLQVQGTRGPTRGEYVFKLTGEGRKRAAEELELSRYVGPAPVAFDDFRHWIERQTIEGTRVSESELRQALDGIVLRDEMFQLLGPAVNSGRSMFLHGESGNGKTLLAQRLARVFGERYYVPYSVLVDGSVMIVYDPTHHGSPDADDGMAGHTVLGTGGRETAAMGAPDEAGTGNASSVDAMAPQNAPAADALGAAAVHPSAGGFAEPGGPSGDVRQQILRTVPAHDPRYAYANRPVVVAGGELTLEQLDLQWDSSGRMYQAPPQLKAAGGVLLIDDLGRQRVKIDDLLNRWGVPLEHRQDHLTLRSGRKMVVPFDCFVIFSTNVQPHALADDSFLRRIHYKIEVSDPDRDEYERIFRGCCEEREIEFDRGALDFLYDEFYAKGIAPRRCHPRDVLDHLEDLAEFRGEPVRLVPDLLERACRSYFLAPAGTSPNHGVQRTAVGAAELG
jgi:hypothetical protein